MKKISILLIALTGLLLCSHAELRTWTSITGQTFEGEYISLVFDSAMLEGPDGNEIKVPLDQLSPEDQAYIQMKNPPELKVDYYDKGTEAKQYVADDWISNDGWATVNHPVFVMDARFGARVRQTSTKDYDHPLTIEMYVFTKQHLDQDKFHMIAHKTSEPFYLNRENGRQHEWLDSAKHRIIFYSLASQYPRGEKLGEHLILIRDIEDNIIAYDASGNWLYKNLDRLQELPLGAWINRDCIRVHPTSPQRQD